MNDHDHVEASAQGNVARIDHCAELAFQAIAHRRSFEATTSPKADARDRLVMAENTHGKPRSVSPASSSVDGVKRFGAFESRGRGGKREVNRCRLRLG